MIANEMSLLLQRLLRNPAPHFSRSARALESQEEQRRASLAMRELDLTIRGPALSLEKPAAAGKPGSDILTSALTHRVSITGGQVGPGRTVTLPSVATTAAARSSFLASQGLGDGESTHRRRLLQASAQPQLPGQAEGQSQKGSHRGVDVSAGGEGPRRGLLPALSGARTAPLPGGSSGGRRGTGSGTMPGVSGVTFNTTGQGGGGGPRSSVNVAFAAAAAPAGGPESAGGGNGGSWGGDSRGVSGARAAAGILKRGSNGPSMEQLSAMYGAPAAGVRGMASIRGASGTGASGGGLSAARSIGATPGQHSLAALAAAGGAGGAGGASGGHPRFSITGALSSFVAGPRISSVAKRAGMTVQGGTNAAYAQWAADAEAAQRAALARAEDEARQRAAATRAAVWDQGFVPPAKPRAQRATTTS